MKREKGFTLLEIVIGLAIVGVLGTVIAAAIPMVMQWAPKQAIKLGVEEDLSFFRYWLTRDANAADSYTSLAAPEYGRLLWNDYNGESTVSYNVTYSYDSASDSVIRAEQQDGVTQTSLPVARKILDQDDAEFTWSAGTSQLSVNITATIEDAPGVGTHYRDAYIVSTVRTRDEPTVSPPGDIPVPPPPPGSETYYLAVEPTITYGTLSSGNISSLHDADAAYYVVASQSVPGAKVVSWWSEGEEMTAPVTITQIEVRYTGQVDKKPVITEFFVKDSAAGFPVTASSGFTFTGTATDHTHSFYLDATALAYVNSLPQRKVTLKVEGTASATWELSSEQVLFIASPP